MSHILALDVGQKRTGVAYADSSNGVPVSLPTISADGTEALAAEVVSLIEARSIDTLVVGLPKLPSGQEGSQAEYVRSSIDAMPIPDTVTIVWLDERYTTPRSTDQSADPDAESACHLLSLYLDQSN